jgi:hypothetical protein
MMGGGAGAFPSADQLRAKSGKTMVAPSAAGHSNVLHARSQSERVVRAKILQPRFCLICSAKALCGKEAFLLKALLVTFGASKVTASAAIER